MQSFQFWYFCFLLLFFTGDLLKAQSIEVQFKQADSLSRHSHTHLSDSIYLDLLSQREVPDQEFVQFRALLGLAKNRLDYFQFPPFNQYIQQAESLIPQSAGLPPSLEGQLYFLKGRATQNRGQLDLANEYLSRAESIFEKDPRFWRALAEVYLFHAQAQIRINDLSRQKFYIDKAFALILAHDKDLELLGDANLQLSRYYRQQNQWDAYLDQSQQAEQNFRQFFGDLHPKVAIAIQQQSHFYDQRGDLNTMLERLERTQTILDQLFPEHYARIGQNAGLLSDCYRRLQRFELAHQYVDLAIDRLSRHLGTDQVPIISDMYRRKALVFEGQDSLTAAISYFRRSLDILKARPGNVRDVSRNYQGLARCFLLQGALEQAESFNQQDFTLLTDNFGADYNMLAHTYLTAGQLKYQQGQLNEAIAQYQLSLEKSAPAFKALHWSDLPRAEDFEYIPPVLSTLQAKAEALIRLGDAHPDGMTYLQAAYDTYLLAIDLIDVLRSTFQSEETRQIIQQDGAAIYQQTVALMFKLQAQTPGPFWTDSILSRINQGKSLLLREAALDREARHFAGIPDSILQVEQELRAAISELQYGNSTVEAPLTARKRKQNLVYLKRELANCVALIREEYPRYYELKYADREGSIQQLQAYLSPNQAMLQFFFTPEDLIVAIMKADQVKLEVLPRPDRLKVAVNQYLRALRDIEFIRRNKIQADENLAEYGYWLYEKLFLPIQAYLGEEVSQLIIIPDGPLAAIPFEQLLMAHPHVNQSYAAWPWLLKKYSISYAYSANRWQQNRAQRLRPAHNIRLAAFAPSYAPEGGGFGDEELFELPYTPVEVKRIQKVFRGDLWLDSLATKAAFKSILGQYDVYHLAMHGVVDNEVPLRSYLGFQSGDLAGDFEKLLLAELYAFDLDARMVVLSACNSGMGRLHASEGMISLSRAFAYGGADAVVMSRWSVADKSTAGLMERFYRQLKKGESKDEALRQAKLTYLTEVDDPLFSHPYYWASFVVIGDVQPIYQNTMWRWAWMPIAVLLFWWLFRYVYYRME